MVQAFLAFLAITGSAQQASDFPWETKWHGQRFAVNLISRGEALKGMHFNGKYNRLGEEPWNQIQTLLGVYMITKLDEDAKRIDSAEVREKLAIETCGSVMTMLSNQQQLYEWHVVYQLDDWRGSGDPWKEVARTPGLAKAILKLSTEEQEALNKLCAYKKKPLIEPNYNTFRIAENHAMYSLELPKPMGSSELKKLIGQARPLLSENKRQEVDAILQRFHTRTEQVKKH